jgi:hypothetical protein
MLRWETVNFESGGPLMPFFIHWNADSVHPSQDAPRGCTLAALEFRRPNPEELIRALRSLGISAVVESADKPAISIRLKTPKGEFNPC